MKNLRKMMPGLVSCLMLASAIGCVHTGTKKTEVAEAQGTSAAVLDLITRITAEDLLRLLAQEGLVPERKTETMILAKMDMVNVLFFVQEDALAIQAYAGFKSDNATEARMNAWNRDMRYSRAYIDNDGDAVLELDLPLRGGVTQASFSSFIKTVRMSVAQYRTHLFD